ncbi:hypothetical protein MAN88_50910 [Microcystis aeruginosa]|nr:potassium channel family protein [Microcystis aeruginosa]BCU14527.1 hypothetical protein MAN88_50910 [Microcystis aeruginosa]
MQSSLKRIIIGASFFLATVVGATIGYMAYGWSFLYAVYMVIITIFGVGFGEVKPINTPSLRAFTMLVIVCGTTSAVYVVGGFFQMLTEGEINKAFSDRQMNKEMECLENHVIICGFGRIGRILTTKLAKTAQSFIIVDNNPDRIGLAKEKGYLTLNGNATDESILQKAGIDKARVLATVLPDDALNVFIENLGLKPRRSTTALLLNISTFTKYMLKCEVWKKPIRFDFTPHPNKSRYCGALWAV